ncbi:MAG: hypothetical protein QXY35_06570 [Thermofilaceae archaeon]
MPVITTEYIVAAAFSLAVLIAVGAYVIALEQQRAQATRVSFDVISMRVVRDSYGLYLDARIVSTSNKPICIHYIEVIDLLTYERVVFGDGDRSEVSNLPVCAQPGETLKLSAYQIVDVQSIETGRVLVRVYYTRDPPDISPYYVNLGTWVLARP